jgi:hypothetical protein
MNTIKRIHDCYFLRIHILILPEDTTLALGFLVWVTLWEFLDGKGLSIIGRLLLNLVQYMCMKDCNDRCQDHVHQLYILYAMDLICIHNVYGPVLVIVSFTLYYAC